jgi:hypothetical protein
LGRTIAEQLNRYDNDNNNGTNTSNPKDANDDDADEDANDDDGNDVPAVVLVVLGGSIFVVVVVVVVVVVAASVAVFLSLSSVRIKSNAPSEQKSIPYFSKIVSTYRKRSSTNRSCEMLFTTSFLFSSSDVDDSDA